MIELRKQSDGSVCNGGALLIDRAGNPGSAAGKYTWGELIAARELWERNEQEDHPVDGADTEVKLADTRVKLAYDGSGRFSAQLSQDVSLVVLDFGGYWQAEIHHEDFCGPVLADSAKSASAQDAVDSLLELYWALEEAMS